MAKHKAASLNTRPTADDDFVWSTKDVLARLPMNRSTLWRMWRSGRFPPPLQLSPGRHGWRRSVILAWLAERELHPIAARSYFGRPHARSDLNQRP